MGQIRITGNDTINFFEFSEKKEVRILRINSLKESKFVVYETEDPDNILSVGECPAHSANPPYCSLTIPGRIRFTIHCVGSGVIIIF